MCKGLTLFEILIVLLIVSIVAAFGLPFTARSYYVPTFSLIQKEIEQAIDYGIQESHVLGEPLRLVPLQNQNWTSGLRLVRESKEQFTLHLWQWPNFLAHVTWHGFLSNAYLRFTPELSQMAVNGYFTIESPEGIKSKLIINRVGRLREEVTK